MPEHTEVDVVVVGAGIAGLTAASRAAQLGLRVALLERGSGDRYRCNTRFSGGLLHVAFRNVKAAAEELHEAINDATGGRADPALVQALASTSGRAVDWFTEEGAKFIRMGQVEWQQWVLAPPRRNMAGMDWEGRGPDYALRTLLKNFVARGGHHIDATQACELLEQEGACIGVEALRGASRQRFLARAVVLADGGFQGNLDMVREHICAAPDKLMQRGAATGIGDGLRMASQLGAAVADLGHFYGHLLSRDAFHNDKAWPYPQIDELGMAGVVVDGSGRRFADEGQGGVALANAIARLPDPSSAWVVFNGAIWDGPGRDARIPANPHLLSAGATMLKADSVQALAALSGLPAQALAQTLDEYGRALAAQSEAGLTPPRTAAVRKAWPIDQPPYMAIPVCAGITYTFGGLCIDEHARVVHTSGHPIGGLYAAGSCTAGLEGRGAPSYVGGLMKALVFGLRAAEHVAS